ncbi:hypothetical protein BU24DRAFT_435490 [Aaosphaeria arxii CBS 175.79]|uniref:PHD-type domain-containing protein n=1 Tax=Aaosphaeria arxii CBS 175.79 TaxID=1450172 RepID=A0A6A5XFN8_9PLEO|nr:uncharacterized protein BU24DRAFT_435490 [Aaosphaeria arxii CBS 175.79]KAF2012055.1 hypothetical protein BU24DRAFT_435490 [Aaosphaeria arxii CBS 175.79]
MMLPTYPQLLATLLLSWAMMAQAKVPVRLISHNIRYDPGKTSEGEKPWSERKPYVLNQLHFNTASIPESFICLQEALHHQLTDVMDGLGSEWAFIGVGRDDGKESGEYAPIIYRPSVWKLDDWTTKWLSENPDQPGKGWDASSVRIVTVGRFTHQASQKHVVAMSTHFDNVGVTSRTESAKLILNIVDQLEGNATSPIPVFLAGDLNSEMSDTAYQTLNAQDSLLQDAKDSAQWKYGNEVTFTGFAPNYTLNNPDTLTKYKVAAQISQKVLQEVSGWLKEGENIVELCERGDKLIEEEVSKVYKGKKVSKGIGHCTTISPSSYITPYTPIKSDAEEAATTLKEGEAIKIQLGAQIDGFPAIVCDTVIVGAADEVTGRQADLALATYYANELLLRLMLPPGLVTSGTEEEQKKAATQKQASQGKITQLLEKVVAAYDCNLVESTTIWLFERNEIEAKKKIILAPSEGVKGEGLPEVGEVWGVEMGVSLGSGKVKTLNNRATLHRRTATTFGLKRPTSRAFLSEVVKKFSNFPFSLRQLEDEKAAKVGVVECVRGGVIRQYEVVGDKNNDPVARLFTTIAITKNGITRLAAPPALDLSKYKTDKKIEDEEILKILEQPIGKTATKKKTNKKKKKPAKKASGEAEEAESDEECTFPTLGCHWAKQEANIISTPPPSIIASRPSRTSTPSNAPDTPAPSSDSKRSKGQSSLDSWIEPPVQKPTPSFEDHGFARHGVLQGMSPLGVGPSAKVKQRTRALDGYPSARLSFGRNGTLGVGEEGVSTPEMTPARELEQEDSERQEEEDDATPKYQVEEEEEDDDYIPKKSKAKTPTGKTPTRGKTPVQNNIPATGRTPVKNGTSRPSTAINSPPTIQATLAAASAGDMDAARQRLTIVVNEAVSRARQNGKLPIETALREMEQESKSNHYLYEIMDSIIRQNATPKHTADFRQYIKDAKKRYNRAQREKQPRKTMEKSSEGRPHSKRQKTSHTRDISMSDDSLLNEDTVAMAGDSQAKPHLLSSAPVIPPKQSPSPLPTRMNSKSPRKLRATNGTSSPALGSDADAGASSKAPTPNGNPPDSVMNSDSDLSDVNEEIVQNGSPEPIRLTTNSTAKSNGTAASRKVKQTQGARVGKKSRANSAKPFGKPERKAPLTKEEIAEENNMWRKREELFLAQLFRQHDQKEAPLSDVRNETDVRVEDEMLDTESLTESQIAVGPPIKEKEKRRSGRGPRGLNLQAGKRLREDTSRLPSPQPGSAATTRPSTPAFVPPTTKRLKLNNGQAARTKRSPVKNRDGPIAGIAHTGGGGSRQSGPDDNDPASPQDSDDFCAACKGAGEFVCCDGCPRVFHYLCCDPPRVEPPDGSFLCYECSPKVKHVDDSPIENFTILGPLFKRLENTNARSFALPKEIQIFFDGVTARDDGSYYEEIKKFPLPRNSGYGYQRPDYLKTHDNDQKILLCVQCGKSSSGKRQMLKCDFCDSHWHLDCCDPPLANPPHISLESSTRDAWKCPRHVDHDLRSGQLKQQDLNHIESDDDTVMVDMDFDDRVSRKVRRPKKASLIEPTFSRGIRNNGLVEIINDPDDDTDGEGNYVFEDLNSKTFRIPEKGVILDFIDKVKHNRYETQMEERRAAKQAAKRRASQQQFAARPIQQQQAALHLAQLANKETDIGLNETSVDALYLSLTAEAPDEVVTAISTAGPPPLTEEKRAELMKLRALIDRALLS